jgi:hypothetical protein
MTGTENAISAIIIQCRNFIHSLPLLVFPFPAKGFAKIVIYQRPPRLVDPAGNVTPDAFLLTPQLDGGDYFGNRCARLARAGIEVGGRWWAQSVTAAGHTGCNPVDLTTAGDEILGLPTQFFAQLILVHGMTQDDVLQNGTATLAKRCYQRPV